MSHRTMSAILVGLVVSATFGCAENPTAPSAVDSTRSDVAAIAVPTAAATPAAARAGTASPSRFGDRTPGVVFVTSQGLYYDTFVVKDPLPNHGKFQLLTNGQTEFGPGQPGYLGGRWWEDLNGNGVQDADDHYFLCPLLPPGRQTP